MNEQLISKINDTVCSTLMIEEIQSDEDLFESGYLDSLAIINLMVALESDFQITLSPETLDLDKFRSIESIHSLVRPLIKVPV
jgi:acyl carrier protein